MTHAILLSPSEAQSGLARELTNLGARLIHWPELSIDAPEDNFALDEAIENLFGYDWLILKNENAAKYFLERFARSHTSDELDGLRILSIGEKTHQALAQTQIHVDVMVDRSNEVFAALESYATNIHGLNFIVPSAKLHRETFELKLEDAGARIDSVLSYRTCSNSDELVKLKALITGGGIDFVVFKQPASVDELTSLLDTDDLQRVLAGVAVACLDEPTSEAANNFGLGNSLMLTEPSASALAQLILSPASSGPRSGR